MHTFSKKVITPYKTSQLYQFISDIDEYPKFIPWCDDLRVLKNDNDRKEVEVLINAFGIHEKYDCEVRFYPPKKGVASVTINSNSAPFNSLESKWEFTQIDKNQSEIHFDINFSLQSSVLNLIITPIMPSICTKMMRSFEERAKELFQKQ